MSTLPEPDGKPRCRARRAQELVERDGPLAAFMQAMGLINDHAEDCVIRVKAERARRSFRRPAR